MGDIADWQLEQGMLDYWEDGGEERTPYSNFPTRRECAYCGKKGLRWASTSDGWRLVDEDHNVHTCDDYWIYRDGAG